VEGKNRLDCTEAPVRTSHQRDYVAVLGGFNDLVCGGWRGRLRGALGAD